LSAPPLDTQKTPEDLKESDVTTLSATIDSVFREADKDNAPAEHLPKLDTEIQQSSIESTQHPSNGLDDSNTNEVPITIDFFLSKIKFIVTEKLFKTDIESPRTL